MSDVKAANDAPIKINQDANIYVTEVMPGNTVELKLEAGRQGYLLCVEGTADISGSDQLSHQLEQHDAAEVFGTYTFTVTPSEGVTSVHMLLVEMQFTGPGRSDLIE